MSVVSSVFQEHIVKAKELKDQGTEFFQAGNFTKALACYTKIFLWTNAFDVPAALTNVKSDESDTKCLSEISTEDQATLRGLKLAANLNCSACYLKLADATRALKFAEQARQMDPSNSKAQYRRGQAWLLLGELDKAEEDLVPSLKAFPNEAGIKAAIASLQQKKQEHVLKERAHYRGLFDKVASL